MAAPASEQIICQMFATFTDFSTSLDQLKAFLTPDYQQIVDGRTLTLDDFLTHAQALREALQSLDADFSHLRQFRVIL